MNEHLEQAGDGESPQLQFGTRTLLAIVAAVAILLAARSTAGWPGVVMVSIGLCGVAGVWAGRTRHSKLLAGVWGAALSLAIIALLLPAVRSSPPGPNSRFSVCKDNLKQLGNAVLGYADRLGHLPPVWSVDQNGRPLSSWRVAILSRLSAGNFYPEFNLDEPWDSPHNQPLSARRLYPFQCPSDFGVAGTTNQTSYVAVIAPGSAWQPGKTIKLSDIKDKLADTILLVEMKNSGIAWAKPRDLDLTNLPAGLSQQNLLSALVNHINVFDAVFADGHVESIPATIPWSDFLAMLTIAGGETIDRTKW